MNKYNMDARKLRNKWRDSLIDPDRCMYCGKGDGWPGLQIHEIERRSQAAGRWAHTANFLVLCEQCHADEFGAMPHARQLAVKLLKDAEHFDLSAWLKIKDPELRAPERVTLRDISQHLEMKDD